MISASVLVGILHLLSRFILPSLHLFHRFPSQWSDFPEEMDSSGAQAQWGRHEVSEIPPIVIIYALVRKICKNLSFYMNQLYEWVRFAFRTKHCLVTEKSFFSCFFFLLLPLPKAYSQLPQLHTTLVYWSIKTHTTIKENEFCIFILKTRKKKLLKIKSKGNSKHTRKYWTKT